MTKSKYRYYLIIEKNINSAIVFFFFPTNALYSTSIF